MSARGVVPGGDGEAEPLLALDERHGDALHARLAGAGRRRARHRPLAAAFCLRDNSNNYYKRPSCLN